MKKTMKKIRIFLILLTALCFLTFSAFAQASDAELQAQETSLSLSFNNIVSIISESLRDAFLPSLGVFAGLFCLVVLCALTNTVTLSFGGRDVSSYISAICFSGYTFSLIRTLSTNVGQCAEKIRNITLAMLPGMVTANAAEGVNTARAGYTGVSIALEVAQSVVVEGIMPCVKLLFVIALVSAISGEFIDLSGLSSFVRSCTVWFLSLSMTVVVTVMHFQNIVAKAQDSISARALRFASVSFVPVVGGLVGESLRTVTESIKSVKAISGMTGVSAILVVALPPLVAILLYKLEILLCAGFAKMLGAGKQAAYLYEINGILNILNAVVYATGICFVLIIGILASGM